MTQCTNVIGNVFKYYCKLMQLIKNSSLGRNVRPLFSEDKGLQGIFRKSKFSLSFGFFFLLTVLKLLKTTFILEVLCLRVYQSPVNFSVEILWACNGKQTQMNYVHTSPHDLHSNKLGKRAPTPSHKVLQIRSW